MPTATATKTAEKKPTKAATAKAAKEREAARIAEAVEKYRVHMEGLSSKAAAEGREINPKEIDVVLLHDAMKSEGFSVQPLEQEALKLEENRLSQLSAPVASPAPKAPKASSSKAKKGGKLSMRAAAISVLQEADGPMHSKEITKIILERKMTATTGKTPEASVASILSRDKGETFVRTDKNTFDLKELNPRAGKSRPAAK